MTTASARFGRCLFGCGALLLLTLLLAAGPLRGVDGAFGPLPVAGQVDQAPMVAECPRRTPLAAKPPAVLGVVQVRVRPRTLAVGEGGLPPPRAP